METSWDSSLHSWAGPAPAVIQATTYSKAARQAEETREELEKIRARIDHMMQAYERSEPVSSAQQAATEIVEDVEQLAAVLGDPVKKRRYQQQVTVFIVGYQESCGQRNSLLSQLQEVRGFFSCSAELGLAEESHSLLDDFPVHMDDVAGTVTAALSSAEAAMSRLVDLNKDIISYMTSALATHSPKRSHRKQVEKALDKAKEEVVQIKHRLLQAQADVETKERQLKDLQQLSEMKAKESRLSRAQLESTQRRLQSLEQESGAQRARLEAELRSRDLHIAELDGFLQEKARPRRDVATQCSKCSPSSPAACSGGLLPSCMGAAQEGPPAGRELGERLAESMVRPEGGFPIPEHSDQPQPIGGPLAHSAVLGPEALSGPARGPREAGKEEEDAEEDSATHPAGGERSPRRGAAAGNGAVQTPEASATCELLAALEAELAAAQLQSHEDTEHWERHCRTMAAEWEEVGVCRAWHGGGWGLVPGAQDFLGEEKRFQILPSRCLSCEGVSKLRGALQDLWIQGVHCLDVGSVTGLGMASQPGVLQQARIARIVPRRGGPHSQNPHLPCVWKGRLVWPGTCTSAGAGLPVLCSRRGRDSCSRHGTQRRRRAQQRRPSGGRPLSS
nr:uncharacterized protein LOC125643913 isoform X2 [Caretta caretta]